MIELKSYELRVISWKLTSQNSRLFCGANLAYDSVLSIVRAVVILMSFRCVTHLYVQNFIEQKR
jgi:hypothetical protein